MKIIKHHRPRKRAYTYARVGGWWSGGRWWWVVDRGGRRWYWCCQLPVLVLSPVLLLSASVAAAAVAGVVADAIVMHVSCSSSYSRCRQCHHRPRLQLQLQPLVLLSAFSRDETEANKGGEGVLYRNGGEQWKGEGFPCRNRGASALPCLPRHRQERKTESLRLFLCSSFSFLSSTSPTSFPLISMSIP